MRVNVMNPQETYSSLMRTIRDRFDAINALQASAADPFSRAEMAAFHGRKIVEGIAFGCLVAIENGLKIVPRDAKGHWNAEAIFTSLKSKGLSVLPSPSALRNATSDEQAREKVKLVIDGIAEKRLSHDQLTSIYRALHSWLHEANPYVHAERESFYSKNAATLWHHLAQLRSFVEQHFISIQSRAFLCVLWDAQDGETKVVSLSQSVA